MTKEYIEENLLNKLGGLISIRQINLSVEELYLIYYNIEAPLCGCGQKRKFNNFVKGYLDSCGMNCDFAKFAKKERFKKTNLEKYGEEHPSQNPDVKEKKKQTCLKNYGTESPSQNQDVKEKKKQTCLKNYGTENVSQNSEVQEKKKNTNMERYGFENYNQKHILNPNNLNEEYIRLNFIKDNMFLFGDIMNYFNVGETTIYNLKAKYNITESNLFNKIRLEDRINALFDNAFTTNTKSIIHPLELDLYSEEFKFAIEYNGLMYHSSGESLYSKFNKPEKPNYHLNKTLRCQEKDIILFHIFENEWLDESTRDIWISKINSILKRNKTIKTSTIKEISIEIAREFIQENCLEQNIYNENMGLFYEDELVMIISLEEDIFKVVSKKHLDIINGKEILIDYIIEKYKRNFKTIINRRWYSWDYINFKISYTEPNSFYFGKNPILEEDYKEGYRKIWDCGNIILERSMVFCP